MNQTRQDQFRGWIARGANLSAELVIPARETGPRPQRAYISVLEMRDTRVGTAIAAIRWDAANDQFRADYTTKQISSFSIQFYRPGAKALAESFVRWIDSELGRLYIDALEMRVIGTIRPIELSEVVDDEWEERVGLDIDVVYSDTYHQDLGRIEEVDLTLLEDNSGLELREVMNFQY